MKILIAILSLSFAFSANAEFKTITKLVDNTKSAFAGEIKPLSTLVNKAKPAVKANVLWADNGVPVYMVFSNDNQLVSVAQVSSNEDSIDVEVGEVYDITGPFTEGNVCNLFGKLTPSENGFSVDLSETGTAFSNCDEAVIAGEYELVK